MTVRLGWFCLRGSKWACDKRKASFFSNTRNGKVKLLMAHEEFALYFCMYILSKSFELSNLL